MGSACRTAPHPRKYPSLSALSTSIPLFGLEPLLRSCRRSQHLVVSTISLHVISIPTSLHVDSIHSCGVIPSHRPHTFMSTSYFHVDLVLSCRPRTSMSTSYFHVDPHTFMSTPTSLLVDIDFHLLLSISRHLCVHLFHVEHIIKYIIDVSQVYHRCRPSTSSMSTKYTIDDVDLVHHAASTFDAQYEGILPVTLTFRLWSTLLSTTIVSRMSFLLS
jgi:hypothetical protein